MAGIAYVNGVFSPIEQAVVSVEDRGLTGLIRAIRALRELDEDYCALKPYPQSQ
jgi:hypothetical protein